MDYLIKKEKKIVYCILDNIEEFYSTTSQEIARNVSDFFLSLVVSKNYDIIIDKHTDALLERAAQDNFYTHAVVVITGTHTGLSERLLQAIEKKCNEFFTLSGHLPCFTVNKERFLMQLFVLNPVVLFSEPEPFI